MGTANFPALMLQAEAPQLCENDGTAVIRPERTDMGQGA